VEIKNACKWKKCAKEICELLNRTDEALDFSNKFRLMMKLLMLSRHLFIDLGFLNNFRYSFWNIKKKYEYFVFQPSKNFLFLVKP